MNQFCSVLCLEDVELETQKLGAAFSLTRQRVISTYFERETPFHQNKRRNRGVWYILLTTDNKPYHVKLSNLFKL